MTYLRAVLIFTLIVFSVGETYSYDLNNQKVKPVFDKFITKVNKHFNTDSKRISILNKLDSVLYKYFEKSSLKENQKLLMEDLIKLNNEKLFELGEKINNPHIEQQNIEVKERLKLKTQLSDRTTPNYISSILGPKLTYQPLNSYYEFVSGSSIKKLSFANYYILDKTNAHNYKDKTGMVIKTLNSNQYWFVEDYELIEKIPFSKISKYAVGFISDQNNYYLEKDYYYSYNFESFVYFQDKYGQYLSDLESNGYNLEDLLVYKGSEGRYNFVSEFKKIKLISTDLVWGVRNKSKFLNYIKDDKKHFTEDSDEVFEKIRKEVKKLTHLKTEDEKVRILYNWILDNVQYSTKFKLSDWRIYSGILTYTNEDGTCSGYSKLLSYALSYALVRDVEAIKGYVIDARDFPEIGHAWVRVGDSFFDPVFDDPLGVKDTKKFNEYKYYNLPRDLFYTNRYDYGKMPDVIKTLSEGKRIDMISENLDKLYDKYKSKKFNILKTIEFRRELGLDAIKDLVISDLKKGIQFYTVDSDFNYVDKNGKTKAIKNLSYFTIDDSSVESMLKQLDYDLDGYLLFLWDLGDGKSEYRLGYNVKYY